MARAAITAVAMTKTGYNLTDSADFSVMGTGADNGVEFPLDTTDIIVLKNTTGGAAVYTFKIPAEAKYTDYGGAVADDTITVAAGKTWVRPLSTIFKQTTGKVHVDCDVAGSILVLSR